MPITPTEKIWMDGELVDWDKATVHVLTHSLHYGMGVFEGIRAYATANGPADLPPPRPHHAAVQRGPHPRDGDALLRGGDLRGDQAHRAGERARQLLHPADRLPRLRRDGPEPDAVQGAGSRSPCWPWGAYLGDEGIANGIRLKVSSWARHDPRAMPTAAKGTGMYINSSLAKVEAMRAGYDEALLCTTGGLISEGTGENIFVVRDGRIFTPPASAVGALEGITADAVVTIARDLGYEVTEREMRRTDLYMADEAFLTGTAAEVVPIASVDDRPVGTGEPGPITRAIQELFFATVRGEVDRVQGLARICHLKAGSRSLSTSTTRRCGTAPSKRACRSPSTTSCASPSSSTTSASPTSKAAGQARTRRTRSSSPGPRRSCGCSSATLVAFGSTRRSGVGGRRGRRRSATSSTPGTEAVCIVAKASDLHVTEALRTTLDEAVAMAADSVALPAVGRAAGVLRRRALLRRLPPRRRVRAPCPRGGRGRPEPRRSCSATRTAARCPTRSSGSSPRCAARSSVEHRRPLPQRRRLRRRQHPCGGAPGGDPGPGLRQRLRRANRQRRPLGHHRQPHPEDGGDDDPGRPARAPHAGRPPHRRARQPDPRPAAALRRRRRPSRTRPACTRAPSSGAADAYEHIPPDLVGNGTRVVVSELAGRSTLQLKAAELGPRARLAGARPRPRRP